MCVISRDYNNLKDIKIENTTLNFINESMKHSKAVGVKKEEKEKKYTPCGLVNLVEKNAKFTPLKAAVSLYKKCDLKKIFFQLFLCISGVCGVSVGMQIKMTIYFKKFPSKQFMIVSNIPYYN